MRGRWHHLKPYAAAPCLTLPDVGPCPLMLMLVLMPMLMLMLMLTLMVMLTPGPALAQLL